MLCTLRLWVDKTQYKLNFQLQEERRLLLKDVRSRFPKTTGLIYFKAGTRHEVQNRGNKLTEPPGGWEAHVYHCPRSGPSDGEDKDTVPGEESFEKLQDWDKVQPHIYDPSKHILGFLPVIRTSSILSDFYPDAPQPRFNQLYGDYTNALEKDPVKKLLDRLHKDEPEGSPKRRTKYRLDRSSSRERSRHRIRRDSHYSRSPRARRDDRYRRRSTSRRSRSRSGRRKNEDKEPEAPGMEEVQVVMQKKRKETPDVDVLEVSSSESTEGITEARSRDRSRESRNLRRSRDRSREDRNLRRNSRDRSWEDRREPRSRDRSWEDRRRMRSRDRDRNHHRYSDYERGRHDGRAYADRHDSRWPRGRDRYDSWERERDREYMSRDRLRHEDERQRCLEERRKIRAERIQLEMELRGKREEARWMEKSEDFLKKLGLPSEADFHRRAYSPDPPSAYSDNYAGGSAGSRYSEYNSAPGRSRIHSGDYRSHEYEPDRYSPASEMTREGSTTSSLLRGSNPMMDPYSSTSQHMSYSGRTPSPEPANESENIFGRKLPSPAYTSASRSSAEYPLGPMASSGMSFDHSAIRQNPGPAAAGGGTDIDLRALRKKAAQQQHNPGTLRPGNYVYVVFDIISLGSGLTAEPYQIGALSPIYNDSFVSCILPKRREQEAEMYTDLPMVWFKNKYYLNNRATGKMEPCRQESQSVADFIKFLELQKNRCRPSFDGVVLICENKAIVPQLMKAVSRNRLNDEFWKTVASVGSMSSLEVYQQSLDVYLPRKETKKELPCPPIESLYFDLFHLEIKYSSSFCSLRAKYLYEILFKQLGGHPCYSNFFKDHTFPQDSPILKNMLRPNTMEDRIEMYAPLKAFITKTLKAQQADQLEEQGGDPSELLHPALTARRMCNSLMEAGFEFDELLEMAKSRGLSAMELHLRTVLLEKMAGQSRTVVDTAIQTTKLVVGFFLQNCHKSFEEIYSEYLEEKGPEETSQGADAKDKSRVTDEYEQLRQFIFRQMLVTGSETQSVKTKACITVLIQANLRIEDLVRMFNELNNDEAGFFEVLQRRLSGYYRSCGPKAMNFNEYLEYVVAFINNMQQSREMKKNYASDSTVPPPWYKCRRCNKNNLHWFSQCSVTSKSSENLLPDVDHLINFYNPILKMNIGLVANTIKSLRILKQPLTLAFAAAHEDAEFSDHVAHSLIATLAIVKVSGNILVQKKLQSNQMILNFLRQKNIVSRLPQIFSPLATVDTLVDCIKHIL